VQDVVVVREVAGSVQQYASKTDRRTQSLYMDRMTLESGGAVPKRERGERRRDETTHTQPYAPALGDVGPRERTRRRRYDDNGDETASRVWAARLSRESFVRVAAVMAGG
jgi:hypothetical protein